MALAPPPGSEPLVSLIAAAGGHSLLLRQLFDAKTGTFSYLLADGESRQGVLIDSVFDQHDRDLALIHELAIDLVAVIDTHAHADHITGSWLMHLATGCAIGLAAAARAENVSLPLQHVGEAAIGVAWGAAHRQEANAEGHMIPVLQGQAHVFCPGRGG